jgi:hypothetical protein
MTDMEKSGEGGAVERPADADFAPLIIHVIGKDTKYLTVDITNGKETTLWELRQRFPRIDIFKLSHLEIYKTNISLYRLDRNFGVKKGGGK